MPGGDHANFPVIYLQIVEGKRPDVIVADKYGYLDPAFLKRLGLDDGEIKRVRSMPRSEADRFVIDRVGKPVLVNSKRSILDLPTERFLPFGLLYRVDRERRSLSREEEDKLWESYCFSNLGKDYSWKRGARDIAADFILVEVLIHQASRLFQRGDADGAVRTLDALREVASGYKELLQNAGSILVEQKRIREAASFYQAALRLDPHYKDCRKNYAQALLASELDLEKAVELADRSLREIEPDAPFLKDLARAYRKLKRFRNAKDALLLASQIEPLDPEPSRILGEIEEDDMGSRDRARDYYAQSLRLKPTQPDLIEKLEGREARERYEEAAQKAMEAMMDPRLPVAAGIQ